MQSGEARTPSVNGETLTSTSETNGRNPASTPNIGVNSNMAQNKKYVKQNKGDGGPRYVLNIVTITKAFYDYIPKRKPVFTSKNSLYNNGVRRICTPSFVFRF